MIVAVVPVRVVEVVADEEVDVIAVGNGLVTAAFAMDVLIAMGIALVFRCASIRMLGVDRQDVLVNVIAVWMVQVSAMQVIHVAVVIDRRVSATWTVLVWMLVMPVVRHTRKSARPHAIGASSCTNSHHRCARAVPVCAPRLLGHRALPGRVETGSDLVPGGREARLPSAPWLPPMRGAGRPTRTSASRSRASAGVVAGPR